MILYILSSTSIPENTMNLSKDLSVDKELFSGERSSKENTSLSQLRFNKFIIYHNSINLFQ
jgi:hypothetical protein